MIGVNVGSGQRPFTSTPEIKWVNVDSQAKWNPDIVCDGANLPLEDESVDYVVLHHCYEHEGLGEADGLVKEAHRILRVGGSLLVFVPNLRALALAWLNGRLDTITYMITLYGAFMGDAADRHKFGYDNDLLIQCLNSPVQWSVSKDFDWRTIPGMDAARDYWILGVEVIK